MEVMKLDRFPVSYISKKKTIIKTCSLYEILVKINIPMEDRICAKCGKNTRLVLRKNGKRYYDWRNVNGECWCFKCWNNNIHAPKSRKKWNSIHYEIYGKRRFMFKNKSIYHTETPRTGQCTVCRKRIGDEYLNKRHKIRKIKSTQMHHIEYHDDNPIKDTVELCVSCHGKITMKKMCLLIKYLPLYQSSMQVEQVNMK